MDATKAHEILTCSEMNAPNSGVKVRAVLCLAIELHHVKVGLYWAKSLAGGIWWAQTVVADDELKQNL